MTKFLVVDEITGKKKLGSSGAGGISPVPQDYDVAEGGQQNFTLSNIFDQDTYMEIFVNNRGPHREGASYDFERNVELNRVEFKELIPEGSWVRIILYL